VGERAQTYVLDRAAIGTGVLIGFRLQYVVPRLILYIMNVWNLEYRLDHPKFNPRKKTKHFLFFEPSSLALQPTQFFQAGKAAGA
jgi:hypothetical protein